MNRVTPQTPLDDIVELMQRDGYVVMDNALTPRQVAELSAAYDEQLALHPPAEGALRVEVKRILERGAVFEHLMDLPATFRVARALIGADVELATGGELDHKFAHTPAYIGWHNDFRWMVDVPYPRQNFWLRCTYFIGDVTADMGPFTLLPGSHHATHAPPGDSNDERGQPRMLEGALGITRAIQHCRAAAT